MSVVKAKKHLGQHFLNDRAIAQKIVNSLKVNGRFEKVLEVGPGMGVLTDILLKSEEYQTWLIDIDAESIQYLSRRYTDLGERLIFGDFLKLDFNALFNEPIAIIGNFPYNISSQILFKILDERNKVVEVVGMFQKEVAERCAAKPGTKDYGILSVLLQAYYDVKYLFTVKAGAFNPPPKVLSGVLHLSRNGVHQLNCNEELFKQVVKAGFNQRRKTLRNSLSSLIDREKMKNLPLLDLRAENLSVDDYILLTNEITETRRCI